jgi:hypothetical protein
MVVVDSLLRHESVDRLLLIRRTNMKYLILSIFTLLITSCASIGSVIDSTKAVATGVLDMTVGTASRVVGAVAEDVADTTAFVADTTAGTINAVAEKVDEETDQLQDEDSPKEK